MSDQESVFALNGVAVRIVVGGEEWLVDPETGVCIETSALLPEEGVTRLEWWQEQHLEATEQHKTWEEAKRIAGVVVLNLMRQQDEWAHVGSRLRSRFQSGGTVRAVKRERVEEAVALGLLSEDDVRLLNSVAVKEYDPKVIDDLVEQEALTPTQRRAIVTETVRAGHVRTERLQKQAPVIAREALVEREARDG